MSGYSGTPLAGAPETYLESVAPLPENVQLMARPGVDTDIVHVFSTRRARLAEALRSTLAKM